MKKGPKDGLLFTLQGLHLQRFTLSSLLMFTKT